MTFINAKMRQLTDTQIPVTAMNCVQLLVQTVTGGEFDQVLYRYRSKMLGLQHDTSSCYVTVKWL